jgi:hypothetical protein
MLPAIAVEAGVPLVGGLVILKFNARLTPPAAAVFVALLRSVACAARLALVVSALLVVEEVPVVLVVEEVDLELLLHAASAKAEASTNITTRVAFLTVDFIICESHSPYVSICYSCNIPFLQAS